MYIPRKWFVKLLNEEQKGTESRIIEEKVIWKKKHEHISSLFRAKVEIFFFIQKHDIK